MSIKINQWIENIQKGNIFNSNTYFFLIFICKYILFTILFCDLLTIKANYFSRHRHRDKVDKDSSNQDVKDRNGSIERFTQKSSQDKEKHKKDKKKKDDKGKRSSKMDANRDKKEEGKDKKENEKEKQEETKEKAEATKNKKENVKERRNDMLEMEVEGKDKKEKDKDKWKEKVLLKSNSWAEVRKSGLTLDDIIYLRRRYHSSDNSERSNIKFRYSVSVTILKIKFEILRISLYSTIHIYYAVLNMLCDVFLE